MSISLACALTVTGAAWRWGKNDRGQLGDGTSEGRTKPVLVLGDLNFTSLAAGNGHTCGVTTDGDGFCWSANGGALGDGTDENRKEPAPIAGDIRWRMISIGRHVCGLATQGDAWCWGTALSGAMGTGGLGESPPGGSGITRLRTNHPLPVAGGVKFSEISAGDRNTCGVTDGGDVWCWGDNGDGQLGKAQPGQPAGGLTASALPIPVSNPGR